MKNSYKVVAVTPAGRKRYMEILQKYIYKNKHILDRWDLWVNTTNQEDINYLNQLKNNDPEFINLILSEYSPNHWGHPSLSITPFWPHSTDEDTVYVRFDDDVVYIADGTIENLVQFRLDNLKYFTIYPFIINNSQHSRNLQDRGLMTTEFGLVRSEQELLGQGIYDPVGLYSVEFIRSLHQTFLTHYHNNTVNTLMTAVPIEWTIGSQVSINGICWMGEFMKKIAPLNNGILPTAEEAYMTIGGPKEMNMPLVTIPNTLIVHFLFSTQRPQDELYDILEKYRQIADV
jgi:hypothetical protein